MGVSRGGVDALVFFTPDLEIWLDDPTNESNATGPGAFNHLVGWKFPGYGVNGSYSVQLTGASFHGTAIPVPTNGLVFMSILFVVSRFRRRKRI